MARIRMYIILAALAAMGLIALTAVDLFGGVEPADVGSVAESMTVDTARPEVARIYTFDERVVRESMEALALVNTFRNRAGLHPLAPDPALTWAAQMHGEYLLEHKNRLDADPQNVHKQDPHMGLNSYTAIDFWDRVKLAGYDSPPFREVIAYHSFPHAAVNHWVETLYHRLPLLDPRSKDMGYGSATARTGNARYNIAEFGAGRSEPSHHHVRWPAGGATNVDISWDGIERPQPEAPPGGFPSGPVITLTLTGEQPVEVLTHTLWREPNGELLPHVFLTPDRDPNMVDESQFTIALYSHDPLDHGTVYRVQIRGWSAFGFFDESWTFTTTHVKTCDRVLQDCTSGRACYGAEDETTCAWPGSGQEHELCSYQNDCIAGLTCVSDRCARYCKAHICPLTCGNGFSLLTRSVGVCRQPAH